MLQHLGVMSGSLWYLECCYIILGIYLAYHFWRCSHSEWDHDRLTDTLAAVSTTYAVRLNDSKQHQRWSFRTSLNSSDVMYFHVSSLWLSCLRDKMEAFTWIIILTSFICSPSVVCILMMLRKETNLGEIRQHLGRKAHLCACLLCKLSASFQLMPGNHILIWWWSCSWRGVEQRRELCRRWGVLLSPKGVFIHSMVYMCT